MWTHSLNLLVPWWHEIYVKIVKARRRKAQRKDAVQNLHKMVGDLNGKTDTSLEFKDISHLLTEQPVTRPPKAVTTNMGTWPAFRR